MTFEDGLKEERKNSYTLATGPQSRALQHFFFSQRQCAKIPGIDTKRMKPLPIDSVGNVFGEVVGSESGINRFDIVGFVESSDTTTDYIKSLFDNWIPLGNTDGWHVRKHGGAVTIYARPRRS